jgi:hypothetical protein
VCGRVEVRVRVVSRKRVRKFFSFSNRRISRSSFVSVMRRHFAASWREKCKYVSEICFLSTWPRERASFANSQCVTRAKTKKMPR